MYLGSLVELATTAALFAAPRHPYTVALLSAVPTLGYARFGTAAPDPARRRSAFAGPPAGRLPLPHPLLAARAARQSGDLRRQAPALAGRKATGGLPLRGGDGAPRRRRPGVR